MLSVVVAMILLMAALEYGMASFDCRADSYLACKQLWIAQNGLSVASLLTVWLAATMAFRRVRKKT